MKPKASELLGPALVDALREIVRDEFDARGLGRSGAGPENLRQLLTRKNMRICDVPDLATNTVSRLVQGKTTRLHRNTLTRLAQALNEPLDIVAAAAAASQKGN